MGITAAQIATKAFNAVSSAIPGSILAIEFFENVQGAYDRNTGTRPVVSTSRGTARAVVDTVKPIGDVFPDFQIAQGDELLFCEGITNMPSEAWEVSIAGGAKRTVVQVQDILHSGAIGYVLVR